MHHLAAFLFQRKFRSGATLVPTQNRLLKASRGPAADLSPPKEQGRDNWGSADTTLTTPLVHISLSPRRGDNPLATENLLQHLSLPRQGALHCWSDGGGKCMKTSVVVGIRAKRWTKFSSVVIPT
ncbi:hypothetical protein CEXT_73141 [Caerostris extrusa]|uniref:Uncharacterized protein n=1 Tax=Caerostris extrusa TaxID=172846 RepID=A0AAV4Y2K2_CAEEX|nr:hypothetical protein CEXT_73141 [Caerostris extrusa]